MARLAPAQLFAIPAWSGGQATACSSCYALPTRQLTRVGLDFLKKGHRNDATKMNGKAQTRDNYFSLMRRGRFGYDQRDGARWQPQVSSKDTWLGGTILSAGTTMFSDKKLFAQVSGGFCAGWFIVSRSVVWPARLVPRRLFLTATGGCRPKLARHRQPLRPTRSARRILIVEAERKTAVELHKGRTESGYVVDVAVRGDDGMGSASERAA